MNRFSRFVSFAGVVAVVFLGTLAAWAAITGSISGVVTDPSGAVVPGVTVVATAVSTNVQSTAVTDAKGFYNLPTLSVDTYNLSTSQPGFRDYQQTGIKIDANSALRVDITMQLGTVTNTVNVKSDALQVETQSTQNGVLIDGIDVRDHDLIALRQHFGVVLQDPFLFTGTIAENIRLGTKSISDADMERAADEVNVLDFIRSLPHGFNELLRERGAGLSTGQKQLINFARALAHRPRILILDEATSSVDTDTEIRVRTALDRMVTGRTSVVIAHRLSTVQRADTILVMHKGQLREHGPHQQLLAQHGIYWKLYRLQYKDQELEAISQIASTPLALGTD